MEKMRLEKIMMKGMLVSVGILVNLSSSFLEASDEHKVSAQENQNHIDESEGDHEAEMREELRRLKKEYLAMAHAQDEYDMHSAKIKAAKRGLIRAVQSETKAVEADFRAAEEAIEDAYRAEVDAAYREAVEAKTNGESVYDDLRWEEEEEE